MKPQGKTPDLEESMAQLETIVRELEDGEIPLEQALTRFEQGVRISRECQQALAAAEQRVQILMAGDLQDFAAAEQPGSPAD